MTGKTIGLLAAQGSVPGAVLGGAVGLLRAAGRQTLKDITIGVGIGAVVGAGASILQGLITQTILDAGATPPPALPPGAGALTRRMGE